MKCLQCTSEAVIKENYQSIPIRVCSTGHRTGEIELEQWQKDLEELKKSLKIA